MSNAFEEGIKQAVHQLVDVETRRVLPLVASWIPGVPGVLAREILSNPDVQAKIIAAEDKAADWALTELAQGIGWLGQLVSSHVGGRLGEVVHALEHQTPPPAAHLTADQVRQIVVLLAAGKLDDALRAALKDLGLLPDAVATAA